MNYFEKRRWKKMVRHLLHESSHARHMREDITAPEKITEILEAESALQQTWAEGGGGSELELKAEALSELYSDLYPMGDQAPGRELVEVVVVALIVAMALRAYFIQPFKIPTGSMQPTLNGINYTPAEEDPNWTDKFLPVRIVKFLVTGKSHKQWKAKRTAQVLNIYRRSDGQTELQFSVGENRVVPVPTTKEFIKFAPGDYVSEGQVLASGWKLAGDHIFVDKIRYNFVKPKRGQVFVFNTSGITHPQIKQNNYYIKRLCGLPGETVSIEPPYLVVNNEKVEEPFPFYRVLHHRDEGYNGYVLAQSNPASPIDTVLSRATDSITLGDGEYLPMGDNSRSSLDGRYFGAVNEDQVVGPAFLVYWPFRPHWGLIR